MKYFLGTICLLLFNCPFLLSLHVGHSSRNSNHESYSKATRDNEERLQSVFEYGDEQGDVIFSKSGQLKTWVANAVTSITIPVPDNKKLKYIDVKANPGVIFNVKINGNVITLNISGKETWSPGSYDVIVLGEDMKTSRSTEQPSSQQPSAKSAEQVLKTISKLPLSAIPNFIYEANNGKKGKRSHKFSFDEDHFEENN